METSLSLTQQVLNDNGAREGTKIYDSSKATPSWLILYSYFGNIKKYWNIYWLCEWSSNYEYL